MIICMLCGIEADELFLRKSTCSKYPTEEKFFNADAFEFYSKMMSIVARRVRKHSSLFKTVYCCSKSITSNKSSLEEPCDVKDSEDNFYLDARHKVHLIRSNFQGKFTDKDIEDKIVYNSYKDSFVERKPLMARVKKYTRLQSSEDSQKRESLLTKEVDSIVATLLTSQQSLSNKSNQIQEEETRNTDENDSITFPYASYTPINQKIEQLKSEQESKLKELYLTDELNYGHPDPKVPVSNVPCGGCGAMLHCQSSSIPGYLPSEIFTSCSNSYELRGKICQRCRFLREHNVALNVNVSPEDYPKVISVIRDQIAMVILVVDLLDFPCSIWPGLLDIIGTKRPVCVVGNKVDLLPKDNKGYLEHIKECLINGLEVSGLKRANIKHVSLISAKTGYGVEELITKIQNSWGVRGDVYLLGCTNVGKSSLFNALINSDFCKTQAIDLLERATVSPWPGTTLNLLKFPLLRPNSIRLMERVKRLTVESRIHHAEAKLRQEQLKETRDRTLTTLIGHIGRTFTAKKAEEIESNDPFSVNAVKIPGTVERNWNPNHEDFISSKWCYDTPGTINPNQILTLLTLEELMKTLPRKLIKPRTLLLRPGTTYFLAGLGRIDYEEGPHSLLLTTFSSGRLPLTLVANQDADQLYAELLGSSLLAVPFGSQQRLKQWPGLSSQPVTIKGVGWNKSAADIVLSSAGWVAVTGEEDREYTLKVYTPHARGIHVRPSLLPRAVLLRGNRLERSQAFRNNGLYVK